MKEMKLSEISQKLESFEETIVFKLIDRAQFAVNDITYKPEKSGFRGAGEKSLLELRLTAQEKIDAQFGKFCLPEERPFFDRSSPRRKVLVDHNEISIDDYKSVNLTKDILSAYISLVPLFCKEGDDGHHGSSVEHDVYALQAISRRVHFGSIYAAECKFRDDPEGMSKLIDANDREALMFKLTRKEVEDRIIARIREKTESTQALVNLDIRQVIKPDVVVDFYRRFVIPLTKKGQVLYLMNRKRKQGRFLLRSASLMTLRCFFEGGQKTAASAF